ncbi:MAG: c-type cytochrome [bacterium]
MSGAAAREHTALRLTTIVLGAGVFLFLLFYAANEPQRLARLADEDDVAKKARTAALIPVGELNFMAHCSECHGYEGEGNLTSPALRSKSFLDAVTDVMLTDVVAGGRPGTEMKPFAKSKGGALSDEEIEGLVAFMRSWQADAPSGDEDPRKPK